LTVLHVDKDFDLIREHHRPAHRAPPRLRSSLPTLRTVAFSGEAGAGPSLPPCLPTCAKRCHLRPVPLPAQSHKLSGHRYRRGLQDQGRRPQGHRVRPQERQTGAAVDDQTTS
jgi:hypothetical protein